MQSEQTSESDSQRVLVLAPRGRDAEIVCELLARAELASAACTSVDDLCDKLSEGAGTAIVARDVLDGRARRCLSAALEAQPVWSDFQLIVFGDERDRDYDSSDEELTRLGNVVELERPTQVCEMLAAVRAALRARGRQYEARRALQARDHFLAVLGHELRNPLAAICCALEVWHERAAPPMSDHCLDVIDRQAHRLTRLVDDLLDVARVSYGKVMLERSYLDLSEVLLACVNTAEIEARSAQVSLELLRSTTPVCVWGDRERLEQVFGNLLTNALKYTPRGGAVRVSVQRDSRSQALVRVVDTGVGIERPMLERVFDLFAQAERSRERAQGGIGIGLALVQTLVQLHGGAVEASSEGLGRGSEFRVTLPLGSAHDSAPPPRKRERSDTRTRRVVLVEDDDDIRLMMQEMLVLRGHDVVIGTDGPQGVARILEAQPDVAFVDVGLPGFDGFEVARRVRRHAGSHVRLVAVTGYGRPEDRARAMAAGFDHQLTKPVRLEDLDAALSRVSAAPT